MKFGKTALAFTLVSGAVLTAGCARQQKNETHAHSVIPAIPPIAFSDRQHAATVLFKKAGLKTIAYESPHSRITSTNPDEFIDESNRPQYIHPNIYHDCYFVEKIPDDGHSREACVNTNTDDNTAKIVSQTDFGVLPDRETIKLDRRARATPAPQ